MEIKTNIIEKDKITKECILLFENGKLQKTTFKDRQLTNLYDVQSATDFELEKLSSVNELRVKFNFTHKIKFKNSLNKDYRIFVNLNKLKLFKINWSTGYFWIQKTNNWMKFIIPIIVSIVTYLLTKYQLCN